MNFGQPVVSFIKINEGGNLHLLCLPYSHITSESQSVPFRLFFEHTFLQSKFCDRPLDLVVLLTKTGSPSAAGFSESIVHNMLPASLREVLAPPVVEVGNNAFPPAQSQILSSPGRSFRAIMILSSKEYFLRVLRLKSRTTPSDISNPISMIHLRSASWRGQVSKSVS